ncbi:polyphosphate kinase 2 family protein [Paraburkholderia sp. FT54]|uniref:PPK2 family polyphosphate kinase n=1 Tax=Paraburkholderia sp. FT54 TaxID=3074437 RepID=UPI002877E145|nr:PPK2 family polyphosphate kinase [Paraburkholderia sp. FT54]WNC95000.1 polyphosphate kinase 2 family protein [Paraburkholderia sp. FT54]
MEINSRDFRVPEGGRVKLDKWPTKVESVCRSREHYQKLLGEHVARLSSLQQLLYAFNRYAVLLIFQAMDAAGKDGAIKHVMSGVNPQGCEVFSFKHPSPTELQHDFLWRTTRDLPERGRIGIFNRSYYEEVLIARVHPEILRNEGLPDALLDEKTVWRDRYRSILDLELHLCRNGTRIVKSYLHISKEEQRKRFLQRIDDSEKNWKFSVADVEENARLIVSRIVLETLEELEMTHPKANAERRTQKGIAVNSRAAREMGTERSRDYTRGALLESRKWLLILLIHPPGAGQSLARPVKAML